MSENDAHPHAATAAGAKKAPPFALIIDDQEGICRIVATALAGVGVESATYATANPAIAALDRRRPDVIFLDVALEQSDAIDVIKGLSEKHYTGIVQLMSGGRLPLLEAMQRIGERYGLVLRPALRKPLYRRRPPSSDCRRGACRNSLARNRFRLNRDPALSICSVA